MNWKNDRCRRACRQDSQKSDCKVRIKQAGTHGIISDYHHSGSDIRLYQRLSRCSKLNSYHRIYQGAYSLSSCNMGCFLQFRSLFIAKYIIGGFGIANTVSKTVVEQYITLPIILAGVIAAITWNLVTWWKGIPSSSSHTLIGGFAGAAIMANGFEAIQLNIILKIAAFIFLAPFIGMVIAFGFTLFVLYICRRAHPHSRAMVQEVATRILRPLQRRTWLERFTESNGYYCRCHDSRVPFNGIGHGYQQHQ